MLRARAGNGDPDIGVSYHGDEHAAVLGQRAFSERPSGSTNTNRSLVRDQHSPHLRCRRELIKRFPFAFPIPVFGAKTLWRLNDRNGAETVSSDVGRERPQPFRVVRHLPGSETTSPASHGAEQQRSDEPRNIQHRHKSATLPKGVGQHPPERQEPVVGDALRKRRAPPGRVDQQ